MSELYGLTLKDVDFKEHCIRVNKQLIRTADYLYKVETPKSESGIRTIPMSDSVYQAFRDVMEKRTPPDVERMIDGYTFNTARIASCSGLFAGAYELSA